MITRWILALGTVGLGALVACGGSEDNSGGGSGASAATGGTINISPVGGSGGVVGGAGGNSGAGGGSAAGGASGAGGAPTGCNPNLGGTCVGTAYAGENLPLDIYIMFDQSCSMSCPVERGGEGQCCMGGPNPRIAPVREAVARFLQDPASNGIGVGIGYFGFMQSGRTTCDPSDYSGPHVPVAALPGNAQAIINSVNSAQPTGETPTGAAIRGACTYANGWKAQNPSHIVVVLLVTDGVPETPSSQNCDPPASIDDAEQAARTCFAHDPSLPVYVLGVGQALQNLNRIAQAGGTDQAYLVDSGDVAAQVLQALNAIRQDATIPCQLQIPVAPPGQPPVDLTKVNVAYCGPSQQPQVFFYVENPAGCGTQSGWHYDDPNNPTQIVLCPNACTTVAAPGGTLSVSVGCQRQPPPVQ
jgi:hypothetical protein